MRSGQRRTLESQFTGSDSFKCIRHIKSGKFTENMDQLQTGCESLDSPKRFRDVCLSGSILNSYFLASVVLSLSVYKHVI